MLNRITYCHAESEQQDLSNGEEGDTEYDIADRPPVIQGTEDKDELGYGINSGAYKWPEDIDHPERSGFGIGESGEAFEGGDGDEKADCPQDKT